MSARDRFASARVARLATVGADARPHLVPVVFALVDDIVVSCVDHKPKRTQRLRRLANIAANPAVSLLVDHYTEEWAALWWVRVDGRADVVDAESELGARAIDRLAAKYSHYRADRPDGPVIVVRDLAFHSWAATPEQ
ncbi:TIGR03668 family PPOX class F420-dependent oxidoreductase [Gordonia aquimaris]|uniref:TIGR03668 family PPOX class F420-dependent oxidoreductase n=1 Tax=Gordonia aquimaris TaxID=2984863 RepID=A0A9X3I5E2_9ACTN|nr:TIGR03668 family PPOX class F420-dependent oxidoreductase [Gordonia aquimaris]MCX2965667.1 TIGR03668 family PPOX class F420-dependent oxidoreductase [Gordonia aquimaris]